MRLFVSLIFVLYLCRIKLKIMKTYLTPEQMLPKEDDLVTIQALVGSLIVSPSVSKEENIKMFNNWLEENYGN